MVSPSSSSTTTNPPLITQVALAGTSNALAAIATNPIDVVKIRLQMHGENNGAAAKNTTLNYHHGVSPIANDIMFKGGNSNGATGATTTATNLLSNKRNPQLQQQQQQHQLTVRQGFTQIYYNEGLRGYYRGLTASIAREMSYSGIRMGLYEPTKLYVSSLYYNVASTGGGTNGELATSKATSPSLTIKVISGAITGCIGSAIANPFGKVLQSMFVVYTL